MSKNFFIFKTKSGQYIGNYLKPDEHELMYGLEFQTQPKGTVLCDTKDDDGNRLILIENPSANIDALRDFHEYYTDITSGVKLLMSPNKFSNSVKKMIAMYEAHSSSKKSAVTKKKPAVKKPAVKKPSVKKKSVKGGAKKKSDKKKSDKKKADKKKSDKKKADKKKSDKKKADKKKSDKKKADKKK
jgi:hypothetical protein